MKPTKKDHIDGNRVINAFMGYPNNMSVDGYPDAVRYHSSWDEIMPVLIKIGSLGYDVQLNSGMRRILIENNDNGLTQPHYSHEIRGNKSTFAEWTTIEVVWTAALLFCQFWVEHSPAPGANGEG